MLVAVVPAQNEEERIQTVLKNLLGLPLDKILTIINGSEDQTLAKVLELKNPNIEVLHFNESLGLDVPRAVGAKRAIELNADLVLFQDGDMVGKFKSNLLELIRAIKHGSDVALTNCYPVPPNDNALVHELLDCRKTLNDKLGWLDTIGLSSPSHGPHALSRKALNVIPLHELAVPPLILTYAKLNDLSVNIATTLPHQELGSRVRGVLHAEKIMQTICGDCLEAVALLEGKLRTRKHGLRNFIGYHQERNFPLLREILSRDTLEEFVACSQSSFNI